MDSITFALSLSFIRRALYAGMLVGFIAPLYGVFLTVRRQALIADTLAHAALAGVAFGALTSIPPLVAGMGAAVLSALLVERLRARSGAAADASLALVLSGGLALAVVLFGFAKSFNASILSYLFGSITTVSETDLFGLLIVTLIAFVAMLLCYRPWFLITLDEKLALSQGIRVSFYNLLFAALVAAIVAVGMRVTGVLLMSALMVIPVVTAMRLRRGFVATLIASVVFAEIAVISGLLASYYFDLAAGGAVVLCSLALYIVISLVKSRY
ncbi:metal ABC transporter permease [Patescibacteria group bacterium]|nr:metal ABC transporter permease [Patescibacteria group bacterium]